MKKLMIACAAVAVAAVAQAASIDWQVAGSTWAMRGGTRAAAGTTVYLVDGTQMDAIVAAINTTTGALNTEDASWYFGQEVTTGTKGKVMDTGDVAFTETTANLVRNKPYDFSALVIDASDAANGNIYYLLSDTFTQNAYQIGSDEPQTASFGSSHFGANALSYDEKNAYGWAKVGGDVPEPTSGLLLLLGVAGLALRRRRA